MLLVQIFVIQEHDNNLRIINYLPPSFLLPYKRHVYQHTNIFLAGITRFDASHISIRRGGGLIESRDELAKRIAITKI